MINYLNDICFNSKCNIYPYMDDFCLFSDSKLSIVHCLYSLNRIFDINILTDIIFIEGCYRVYLHIDL